MNDMSSLSAVTLYKSHVSDNFLCGYKTFLIMMIRSQPDSSQCTEKWTAADQWNPLSDLKGCNFLNE